MQCKIIKHLIKKIILETQSIQVDLGKYLKKKLASSSGEEIKMQDPKLKENLGLESLKLIHYCVQNDIK